MMIDGLQKLRIALASLGCGLVISTALAQDFGGGINQQEPIEVSAEQLVISEESTSAELIGEVIIAQGELRLAAPRVFVLYTEDRQSIARMEARGGVLLVSAEDAAEAREADFDVDANVITLRGNVLLTRADGSALASEEMQIDLESGRADAQGRVRTILVPGSQ